VINRYIEIIIIFKTNKFFILFFFSIIIIDDLYVVVSFCFLFDWVFFLFLFLSAEEVYKSVHYF
jgi:hypothetical protein